MSLAIAPFSCVLPAPFYSGLSSGSCFQHWRPLVYFLRSSEKDKTTKGCLTLWAFKPGLARANHLHHSSGPDSPESENCTFHGLLGVWEDTKFRYILLQKYTMHTTISTVFIITEIQLFVSYKIWPIISLQTFMEPGDIPSLFNPHGNLSAILPSTGSGRNIVSSPLRATHWRPTENSH